MEEFHREVVRAFGDLDSLWTLLTGEFNVRGGEAPIFGSFYWCFRAFW